MCSTLQGICTGCCGSVLIDFTHIFQGCLTGAGAIIRLRHYRDVIMSAMVSQITSRTTVYSNVYSGADQRKYQSPASLAFVQGIHRWSVNSPHIGPVRRKMFPFDDVIIESHESVENDKIIKPKQSTSKVYVYSVGYTINVIWKWRQCAVTKVIRVITS